MVNVRHIFFCENYFRYVCESKVISTLASLVLKLIPVFDMLLHAIVRPLLTIVQYIPRNMHTVFALLCFVVVIHWLIFPYPSGLLHWHCGNLTIAPVPAKQPWWIWINTSCEFIMNDCITTTKQSTTKPCAYFLGYTVYSVLIVRSMFINDIPFVGELRMYSIHHLMTIWLHVTGVWRFANPKRWDGYIHHRWHHNFL